jgi:GT2 family glycosyltransferase
MQDEPRMSANVRLAGFITTMNRPQVLKETLHALQSQTRSLDHVLIVDNANSIDTRDVVASFPASWISYHGMKENAGPAGASAFALERLSAAGYDWIWWGDDDNPPGTADTIERLLAVAARAPKDVGAVGAVGAVWDWRRGQMFRLPDEALKGTVDVDIVAGNQQLILRREAVTSVGLPDARLFFGFEEPEYCLRIRRAGYRVLVDGDMMRECRVRWGRLDWTRSQTSAEVSHHTIWRRYYSTRNYIYAMRNFERPDLARHEMLKSVGRAVLSWRRGLKFGCAFTLLQLRGVIDGYRGHMGRTVVPTPKYPTPIRAER